DPGIYGYWGRMGLTQRHKGQEKYHTQREQVIATLKTVQDFVSLNQNLTPVQYSEPGRFAKLPRQISCLGKTTNESIFQRFFDKCALFVVVSILSCASRLIRFRPASALLLALMATAGLAHAEPLAPRPIGFNRNLYATDPAAQSNSFPEATVIIVNGRTLAGPNSSAQQRGGRLFVPVAIVAALLDVSIQREEGRAIRITRGGTQGETVRAGAGHARLELYQLEYDYNASRYTSFFNHNLTLRGSGRLGDGRFTFFTN